MELRAVFEVLVAFPPDVRLHIQIDSQYVMNIFTIWLPTWRANNWRTANKKPVANRVAVERTAERLEGRDVKWEHVRGHAGHPLNELADKAAHAAATAVRTGQSVASGPGSDVRSRAE